MKFWIEDKRLHIHLKRIPDSSEIERLAFWFAWAFLLGAYWSVGVR